VPRSRRSYPDCLGRFQEPRHDRFPHRRRQPRHRVDRGDHPIAPRAEALAPVEQELLRAFGGRDGFRISFAADEAVLDEAIRRIAAALA
jgi:hypothetical protein